MPSDDRLSTRSLLWWLLTDARPLIVPFLLFHLIIEGFPLIEDLHQLIVDLITIELFKNVLLMLKLVLRLLSLFGPLLLLDYLECILWGLSMALSSLLSLTILFSLWVLIDSIDPRRQAIVLDSLLARLALEQVHVYSSDAK